MSKRSAEGQSSEAKKSRVAGTTKQWELKASKLSIRTINPIRAIVDQIKIPQSQEKTLIPLSIGDPTVFGNLEPPTAAVTSLVKQLFGRKFNGYGPAFGLPLARQAIAKKFSTPTAPLTESDIIIASGCSGALTIAIQALCDEGDNILVPRPGFSLYSTIAGHSGTNHKYYNLLPERQWEMDIGHLEAQIDDRTKAIVVNNPANPTGSNYSKEHLLCLLQVAEKHKIPIIADEIYGHMVFPGETFYPLADLTTEVPILTCGGLAKQYLVPGWRVGWIMVNDRHNRLQDVKAGMIRLSNLVLGANTLVQSCIPDILMSTEPEYYTRLMATLAKQAQLLIDTMSTIPGLTVVVPQGAMYLMVRIDPDQFEGINNDMEFSQQLLDEEMLFVLPGQCFEAPNYVRFVFCAPEKILLDACERLRRFCAAKTKKGTKKGSE